jgi:NAD-dependent deacetylase
MTNQSNGTLDEIVDCLQVARSLVVLTGAGVSAESGIPTFRDQLTGLWERYRPEDLATPEAFAANAETVTRWYDSRRILCSICQPNPGHVALAELERRLIRTGREFILLTQNVDRLHQRAGSRRVVELHGTLWKWRCTGCGEEREELETPFASYPPLCECGGKRRPAVVWFGEMLAPGALQAAYEAVDNCDVFLSLGTSAVVEPAAGFARRAKKHGARIIEINLLPTPISDFVDCSLYGKSGEILPQVVQQLHQAA